MDHCRLVHCVPFEAMGAIAVDEGGSGRGQTLFGSDQPCLFACPGTARSVKDRPLSWRADRRRTDCKRIAEQADRVVPYRCGQDMICPGESK